MTYANLDTAWTGRENGGSEGFFVGYALNGRIVNRDDGVRAGLPQIGPIGPPENEPSPLNVEWRRKFAQEIGGPWDYIGVL